MDAVTLGCGVECGFSSCYFNFTTRRGPGICCIFDDNGRCVSSCEPVDGRYRVGDTLSHECGKRLLRENEGLSDSQLSIKYYCCEMDHFYLNTGNRNSLCFTPSPTIFSIF